MPLSPNFKCVLAAGTERGSIHRQTYPDTVANDRDAKPPGDEWLHIEELKKTARRYLDEHEHTYPKGYDLPSGHWGKTNKLPAMPPAGERRCGVQARADVNFWASGGFDVVTCGRVPGHAGAHICAVERLIGPGRWRIVSWSNDPRPERDS
jgi:hypothetical protein